MLKRPSPVQVEAAAQPRPQAAEMNLRVGRLWQTKVNQQQIMIQIMIVHQFKIVIILKWYSETQNSKIQ